MSKELTKSEASNIDWSKFETTGAENIGVQDLQIPYLQIVQKGSPEVDKGHKDYATKRIKGVESGDIIDTVTREIVFASNKPEKLLEVIPCGYLTMYLEFRDRNQGGGFVAVHTDPRILTKAKRVDNKDILENGNELHKSAQYFVLYKDNAGVWRNAILSMKSTQLKKSRNWNSLMTSFRTPDGKGVLPIFARRYFFGTATESSAKGSWFGWLIAGSELIPDAALIDQAYQLSCSAREDHQRLIAASATQESQAPAEEEAY